MLLLLLLCVETIPLNGRVGIVAMYKTAAAVAANSIYSQFNN